MFISNRAAAGLASMVEEHSKLLDDFRAGMKRIEIESAKRQEEAALYQVKAYREAKTPDELLTTILYFVTKHGSTDANKSIQEYANQHYKETYAVPPIWFKVELLAYYRSFNTYKPVAEALEQLWSKLV